MYTEYSTVEQSDCAKTDLWQSAKKKKTIESGKDRDVVFFKDVNLRDRRHSSCMVKNMSKLDPSA